MEDVQETTVAVVDTNTVPVPDPVSTQTVGVVVGPTGGERETDAGNGKDADKSPPLPSPLPPPPPYKQKAVQKVTLGQMTIDIPRDIHGWTNSYIQQQALASQAAIDKEHTLPTVMAIQELLAGIKTKHLASAPLEYVEYIRGKCPVHRIGTTDVICIGNKSTTGYVLRAHLDHVKWILLGSLRTLFGQDVDIHVVEYYPSVLYWPSYCYLTVGVINVSLVYSRLVGEVMNPRMRASHVPPTSEPQIKK